MMGCWRGDGAVAARPIGHCQWTIAQEPRASSARLWRRGYLPIATPPTRVGGPHRPCLVASLPRMGHFPRRGKTGVGEGAALWSLVIHRR